MEADAGEEARKFKEAEGKLVLALDSAAAVTVPGVTDGEQLRLQRNVSTTLRRIDGLVARNLPVRDRTE